MKAKRSAVCCALFGLAACQGSLEGASDGTAGVASGPGAAGAASGGAAAMAPSFDPLGGPTAIACDPATRGLSGRRVWRLTRQQYENSVTALLGDATHPARDFNPEPGSAQGFQNDAFALRVRGPEAAQFRTAAHALAGEAAKRLAELAPCAATTPGDAACAASVVADWGRRVFRRPLTDGEKARYLELYQMGVAKRDAALGFEALIEGLLQSPHFLYRSELGGSADAGKVRLTGHELAALLSYTFVGGPPDAELAGLADSGALDVPATLEAQARRLLGTAAVRPAQWEFYRQLFEVTSLPDAPKDASVFPEFEAARGDLEGSARAFVEQVLFTGDARLGSLFSSTQVFVNQGIAPFFGLTSQSAALEPMTAMGNEHPGLLGQPAVLAVLAARTRTSPVNRGRFVRQRLLCEQIPDPPAGVDTQLPMLDPGLTARQQLDAKTGGAACTGCHSLMNPVGFGFEKLDGIGRYRSIDNGQPIDDSGNVTGTRDIDGAFQGLAELSSKLAGSAQVQECLAVQGFRYVLGRPESTADACSIAEARDRFVGAGLDLKELFVAIAATESFGSRKAD